MMPECANCRAIALWKSGGEYLCRDCLVALIDADPPPEDLFAERLSTDRDTLPAPLPASTLPPAPPGTS